MSQVCLVRAYFRVRRSSLASVYAGHKIEGASGCWLGQLVCKGCRWSSPRAQYLFIEHVILVDLTNWLSSLPVPSEQRTSSAGTFVLVLFI